MILADIGLGMFPTLSTRCRGRAVPVSLQPRPFTPGITILEYDANVFLDGLESSNLMDAIGDPIGADAALVLLPIGHGGLRRLEEAAGIDFSGPPSSCCNPSPGGVQVPDSDDGCR